MIKKLKNIILSTFHFPRLLPTNGRAGRPLSTRDRSRGMTVVELIVIIGIVGVVSTVVVFNYSKFRTNVSLRGLSQEIALSIRKAQTFATSVQSINGSGNTNEFPGFGISFSLDAAGSGAPYAANQSRFVIFADIPSPGNEIGDGLYSNGAGTCGSPTAGNECVESFNINTTDRIVELCVPSTSSCMTTSGSRVDIVFNRPAADALICTVNGAGTACQGAAASSVKIKIRALSGREHSILVWNTGQISVE